MGSGLPILYNLSLGCNITGNLDLDDRKYETVRYLNTNNINQVISQNLEILRKLEDIMRQIKLLSRKE